MTRILAIGLHYPPHHIGGYEVSCRDVMERLADRGHEVAVLTSDLRRPGVSDPPGERDGRIPVCRDLVPWFRDEALWAPPWWARWRIERANQRALVAALDRTRPDVVSAWQLGGLSIGLLTTVARRGIPIVYALSDDWLSYAPELDAWNRLFRRVPNPIARLLGHVLRVPTTVPDLGSTGPFCFISDATRQRAEQYTPWSMDDTALVYSGIDGRLFEPGDGQRGARPWGAGRLLYVGRYDPRKGIETTIRAMPQLPGMVLEVQGTGDAVERDRLAALAGNLGISDRVEFAAVDRAGLPDRYRAADLVVFPSEWEEPFGLVPVEAMACGTPVVATGVGGSNEFLVGGRNCIRFRSGDADDLAAAVRRVAADADLRERMVADGFRTAEYFDVDRLADAFEAWHDAAAARFADGRPRSRSFDLDAVTADGPDGQGTGGAAVR
ncbi:MAG: glycosyltransferase family 4 protein [Actinomycetota bacterium]|nr:glycosyltransferase family 4 protein [Acidimicrobiia bacterium]MDQ3294595.1 glycosyltransferase family 4 protein [Actinomycetota bacterium]